MIHLLFLILIILSSLCYDTLLASIPHIDIHKLTHIDNVITEAIENKQCAGTVVLISQFGEITFFRSYGNRSSEPPVETMTTDTIFDLASLTKPLATATAIMMLVEQKKIALNDLVIQHIPELDGNGKERITIEQLLRHRSGLPPDSPADNYSSMKQALQHINTLPLLFKPGTSFCYSCIGYIILGEIIQRISGTSLNVFTQKHIFEPLHMYNTMFNPPSPIHNKIAPTEKRHGIFIRGTVHDPRAYALGGMSGNAGLFSCAQDIATFAHMMLNKGVLNNVRILDEKTIMLITSPGNLPRGQRYGLGWDIDTLESSPPHDGIPLDGFGHRGFTGVFLWIDPTHQLVIITLTNRLQLHPDRTGNTIPLQKKITALVADALIDLP